MSKKIKFVSETFLAEAQKMSLEELKKNLINSLYTLKNIEEQMKNDPKLLELKESIKDISGAYRDAMKLEKEKMQVFMSFIEDRIELDNN